MIKKILVNLALIVTLAVSVSQLALAETTKCAIQSGVNGAAGTAQDCSQTNNPPSDVQSVIGNIINVMSLLVGAVAVIMLIVGGFRFVTSAGNEQSIAASRKTIIYALVGIVIAATAQTIVHFVLNNVT